MGVAEDPAAPAVKATFFTEAASQVARFPALKALVYFDSPKATSGDTRTNSSSLSQTAFNTLVAAPALSAQVP